MVYRFAFAVAFVLASAPPMSAAPILEVGGRLLLGARNVDVGGTLYDVEFGDGSCIALFAGCDDVSDFTFQTDAQATAASGALIQQVLLDTPLGNFDTNPMLTVGCGSGGPSPCFILTPYAFDTVDPSLVLVRGAGNHVEEVLDAYGLGGSFPRTQNPGGEFAEIFTYARWTPVLVPEPDSMTLLSLGLAGLGARRWRQRRWRP